MQKKDVDNIVEALLKEEWRGETYKDFKEKLGEKYSKGQIERIRARYKYVNGNHGRKDEYGNI
ncbi:MAG: hypothetical protein K1W39_15880 [Lachnospiraceae bacterium]|nr:hypothetical protein [Lachnospiraceae bacterium]